MLPRSHSQEGLEPGPHEGPPALPPAHSGRASRSQSRGRGVGGPHTRFVCSSCSASSSTACECFCLMSWIWASWVLASSSRVFFRMFTSCSRLDLNRETPSEGRPGPRSNAALVAQSLVGSTGHPRQPSACWLPSSAVHPVAQAHRHTFFPLL